MSKLEPNPDKIKSYKLTFSFTIGILMALLIIVFTFLFIIFPELQAIWIYISALLGVSGTIYSALLISQNLKQTNLKDSLKHSYEITTHLNSPEFMKVRKLIYENLLEGKVASNQVATYISSDNEREYSVKTVLNTLEIMSTSIKTGLADEKYLFDIMQCIVNDYFVHTKPYIDYLRVNRNSSTLFIELELLNKAWNNNVLLSTGEKIE